MSMGYKVELVEILWLDAEDMEPGWGIIEPEEITDKNLTATYGLKAGEDKYWIYHASTYNPSTQEWASRGKIPKEMVHSIRVIETIHYEI